MKIDKTFLKKVRTIIERQRLSMDDAEQAIAADPQQAAIRAAATYLQQMGYSSPNQAPQDVQAAASKYGQAVAKGENPQIPARASTNNAPAVQPDAAPTAPVAPVNSAAVAQPNPESISYAEIDNALDSGFMAGKNMRVFRSPDDSSDISYPLRHNSPNQPENTSKPQPNPQLYTNRSGKGHTVKRGETLSSIAKKYGLSMQALIKMNPQIPDPNRIGAGSKVKIPSVKKKPATVKHVNTAKAGPPTPPLEARGTASYKTFTPQQIAAMKAQLAAKKSPSGQTTTPAGTTAGSFQISQSRSPTMRESIDVKIKNYVKALLAEADAPAMSQQDMVKAIQQAIGVPPDGIYSKKTQTAVTQWFASRGIPHHGHTNWVEKIQEEYDEIVGAASNTGNTGNTGGNTDGNAGGNAAAPETPAVCRIDNRTDDPAKVQQLTTQIIEGVQGIMNNSGQLPMTYGARINSAINNISQLASGGKVAEVAVVTAFQQSLNMTPKDAFTKISEQIGSRPTGAAVINVISGLNRLYDVFSQCGNYNQPAAQETANTPEVPGAIAAKGLTMNEGKAVFSKKYVKQVIREELQKVKKKLLKRIY